MAILRINFSTKYAVRIMQAQSFRLHQIKLLLADYEKYVIYEVEDEGRFVRIKFSEDFPDELNKEVSEYISRYFTIARNKIYTHYDMVMETKYENGEELIFPPELY